MLAGLAAVRNILTIHDDDAKHDPDVLLLLAGEGACMSESE
jgi:hypothetical protein